MTDVEPVIHIVDDDMQFRTAIDRLLRISGYQTALYESGDRLLAATPIETPGCLLLDVHMVGLGGLEVQERLLQMNQFMPIVFLTGQGDLPMSVRAIKAGAEDFLSKPVSKANLLDAIERALQRGEAQRALRRQTDSLRAQVAKLTVREREVFELVVRGRMNKQIAFELGTSERTVKAHRHAVMTKLNVNSVAEAVSLAERLGMLR